MDSVERKELITRLDAARALWFMDLIALAELCEDLYDQLPDKVQRAWQAQEMTRGRVRQLAKKEMK